MRRSFHLSPPGQIPSWRGPTCRRPYLSLPRGVPACLHLEESYLKGFPPGGVLTCSPPGGVPISRSPHLFYPGGVPAWRNPHLGGGPHLDKSSPGGVSAWRHGTRNPLLDQQLLLHGSPGRAEPGLLTPPVGQGPAVPGLGKGGEGEERKHALIKVSCLTDEGTVAGFWLSRRQPCPLWGEKEGGQVLEN